MLGGAHPVVPADLADRAADQGRRLLRRRRAFHAVLAVVLLAALVAGIALAMTAWPSPDPLTTTPTVGW